MNFKATLNTKSCSIALLAFLALTNYAQNVGINSDGASPNSNAMLDIVSPSTGNGKGLLIPRVTEAQRTTASAALAGGLLDNSGNLRGGTAQGLLVYQTNSTQGFYYNTSTTATPNWVFIGTGTGDGSVSSITAGTGLSGGTITNTGTISMPNTGTAGTYTKVTTDAQGRVSSGTTLAAGDIPNLDSSKITTGTLATAQGGLGSNASGFTGLAYITGGSSSAVPITTAGRNLIDDLSSSAQRSTLGLGNISTQTVPYTLQNANGTNGQFLQTNGAGSASWGTVTLPLTGTTINLGTNASSSTNGVAVGEAANGINSGIAIGYKANGNSHGSALGYQANGNYDGAALGYLSNGYDYGVAIGSNANGYAGSGPYSGSVSIGYQSNSYSNNGKYAGGVAVGYRANARHNVNENDTGAVAVGFMANSYVRGAAVGWKAAGYNQGTALGYQASGSNQGVGVGYKANGAMGSYGTAIGYMSNGGGSKNFTFAKGAFSKCKRYNEEWKTSDGINNKFGYGQVNFHGTTTDANLTEIYLGGVNARRFYLADNSVVTFQGLATGINTNTGDSSGWRVWGVIKRRSGAATTAIIGAVTIDAKTEGGLTTNPTFTADTTNGALKVQVTGVNPNTVVWNVMLTYSEVRETAQ